MTHHEVQTLKAALREAFAQTIKEIGIEAFKATSWFGSNDSAFKAATLKNAA
jgi:hypothetical protein